MTQYIDKDALVAEIERRIKTNKECMLGLRNLDYYQCKVDVLNDTISFINTLEVKEVDLEKELDSMITPELKLHKALPSLFDVAKHFFELGMSVNNKAQKGE